MTREELREHPEYEKCMRKIKGYRPGFRFVMDWTKIPRPKANALRVVLQDAMEAGYLTVERDMWTWDCEPSETEYRRTEKEVAA